MRAKIELHTTTTGRGFGMTSAALPMAVAPGASILDTLKAIDRGLVGSALCLSGSGKLIGLVTDGDVRRALITGSLLTDPIEPLLNTNPITVGPQASRSVVLDLMKARSIHQIPIVDDTEAVVGVHVLHAVLGRTARPNTALILAGGKGTRLGTLTKTLPKPMMPVAGRPILDRMVTHLVGFGIEHIYLSVGYLGHVIEDYFGSGEKFGCTISYLREDPDKPLDTGGPLGLLAADEQALSDPIIVLNGDLVSEFNVDHMLQAHQASEATVTVAVTTYALTIPYGVVETGDDNVVTGLKEKPLLTSLCSAGIYVFNPDIVASITPGSSFPITDLVSDCVNTGKPVVTWEIDSDWVDVGMPSDLAAAQGRQF